MRIGMWNGSFSGWPGVGGVRLADLQRQRLPVPGRTRAGP